METGGSMRHEHGFPIIAILNRINPNPSINIYLFKTHSNILFIIIIIIIIIIILRDVGWILASTGHPWSNHDSN